VVVQKQIERVSSVANPKNPGVQDMVEHNVQRYECCQNCIEDREEEKRRNELTNKIALEGYEGHQHGQSPFRLPVVPE
jgi:hypothetical protein